MLFIVAILLIPVAAIWNGFALTVLWGWFVVPVFSLPALTIVPAIGIAMTVGYLTHQPTAAQEHKGCEEIIYAIVMAIGKPALALGCGWVVHLFM